MVGMVQGWIQMARGGNGSGSLVIYISDTRQGLQPLDKGKAEKGYTKRRKKEKEKIIRKDKKRGRRRKNRKKKIKRERNASGIRKRNGEIVKKGKRRKMNVKRKKGAERNV